jgi:hypothetical protein
MDWLKTQIAAAPKLALLFGQALFGLGSLLIVSGLIGRVATAAINSTRNHSKLPPLSALRDAYPTYTLWWVPETVVGYVLPALLAAAGIYVGVTAKGLLKAQRGKSSRRRR